MNPSLLDLTAQILAAIVGAMFIFLGISSSHFLSGYVTLTGASTVILVWLYLATTSEMLQVTRDAVTRGKYLLCCKLLHSAILVSLFVNAVLISIMAFE